MTRAAPKSTALSGDQQRAIDCARELAEASATVETLAAYLGVSTQHPGQFFYGAYGAAMDRLRDLLASLDEAGARQASPGGGPPHSYIPDGPAEAAPPGGYCPPEVRQEAFDAVLEGVETGAYDRRITAWLAGLDDSTCRTIASLLWRCRLAGAAAAPGSVVLASADAEVVRQALADGSAWRWRRAEGAGCGECQRLDPGRCAVHAADEARAASYDSLLRRLGGEDAAEAPGEYDDPAEDDDTYTCSTCGACIGMFLGRAGWQHYRGNPLEIYDAGHEATLALGRDGAAQ